MTSTEEHAVQQAQEGENETFYDSSQSLDCSGAFAMQTEGTESQPSEPHSQQSAVEIGSTAESILSAPDQLISQHASETKITYTYRSPRKVRRSQRRGRKRRCYDASSRSGRDDFSDEYEYMVAMDQMEERLQNKFDSRLDQMESKFESILTDIKQVTEPKSTTDTGGITEEIRTMMKDFQVDIAAKIEAAIDDKIGTAIDAKIDARMNDVTEKMASLTSSLDAQKKALDHHKQSCMLGANVSPDTHETLNNISSKLDALPENEQLQAKFNTMQTQINDITAKLEDLNSGQKSLNKHLETVEFHSRKLNLIFEGIKRQRHESCKHAVERVIHRYMRLDMMQPVDIAHTLDPPTEGKQQAIIARFRTVADKSRVLENSQALSGTDIYIRPDYPKSIIQKRSYLAQSLKAARATDKTATLIRDKLRFNGQIYTVDNIHNAEIGEDRHTMQVGNQVRFYRYLSPFSNFHRAQFRMNSIRYTSVEQAFQGHRAMRNGDRIMFRRIMSETNPVAMKRMAKIYQPKSDEERRDDLQFMEEAVRQKFEQNKELAQTLLATGNKLLLECNPHDNFFSTGLDMKDKRLSEGSYLDITT